MYEKLVIGVPVRLSFNRLFLTSSKYLLFTNNGENTLLLEVYPPLISFHVGALSEFQSFLTGSRCTGQFLSLDQDCRTRYVTCFSGKKPYSGITQMIEYFHGLYHLSH